MRTEVLIVDSSAACAILFNDIEADRFDEILADSRAFIPVSCFVETTIAHRRWGGRADAFERFLIEYEVQILPADAYQARLARDADRRYGRGTGHPAGLNFGDCLAYAAAKAHDAPLLFKGDDFVHTDVKRAR